ncbi:thiamine-phosphate kinase [uncultured Sneathiella sp.]|uniref:thiamine-phosphate kinase n=1 Tax=uncultured Sneathiella sp. TaxID=879315 RepID=UPI0030EC409B|tara:strand:- start:36521 stop:37519 length:999 start_codon:yes stop_codon:yes gene_type:complete
MTEAETGNGNGEFALIDRLLKPLAAGTPAALDLTDDAAVLVPTPGQDLVLAKDAMVAGVHFLENDPAEAVARKLLRVNLSDLAAMGATPVGYLLATFWPEKLPRDWIEGFVSGLQMDQEEFGIGLLGGDTVRTPGPLSLSLTAIGEVAAGKALRRNGAGEGDLIVVSGTLGDGALGLLALKGELGTLKEEARQALVRRYHLPQPRLALGRLLTGRATACIDISDGPLADIGHIAKESNLGAVIEWARVPLSDPAREVVTKDSRLREVVLTGGDDYELAFTLPPALEGELDDLAKDSGIALTVIGRMTAGEGVRVVDEDGSDMPLKTRGWQHF